MHLVRALLYLRWMTIRNLVLTRLRRLRQPKYLFGALAALAYFWFFFLRRSGKASPVEAMNLLFAGGTGLEVVASVILTMFLVLIWVAPGDDPGLNFKEAEVAFLFAAPLTRRQLIHYKLLDGLAVTLLGAIFFSLISGGFRHGFGGSIRHLLCWWSLNANLSLHQTGAGLAIGWLSKLGLRSAWRRTLLLGALVVSIGALIAIGIHSGAKELEWVLWPARLAVRPFLAASPGAVALALLPAFGLVALQYFWILRLETPFEEASIARAKKTGEMVARFRSGRNIAFGKAKAKRAPFALKSWLPLEAAFLWKNLMAAPSYLNRTVFLACAIVAVAVPKWLQRHPEFDGPKIAAGCAFLSLVLLIYLLLFGPHLARNDLRGDLLNADILKTYPLPGWRIVLGGLLAPTVILTSIAWIFLIAATAGLAPGPGKASWLTPEVRLAGGGALALVMPALCAVQLLVPNAATLVFPAWAQTGKNNAGGMDVMGQRLIFFVGQFICLAFAVLPALVAGGGTIFLTQWLIGAPAAILLAAIPVLGIFIGELCFGVWWLGPKFERLDISAELRA